MKLITRTDEYTIYQRRDERYAVEDAARKAVNGEEKIKILLANKLIKAPAKKAPEPAPEPEAVADEAVADEAVAEGDAPADGDAKA